MTDKDLNELEEAGLQDGVTYDDTSRLEFEYNGKRWWFTYEGLSGSEKRRVIEDIVPKKIERGEISLDIDETYQTNIENELLCKKVTDSCVDKFEYFIEVCDEELRDKLVEGILNVELELDEGN